MDVLSPLIRILLRYIGGALIAKGYAVNPDTFADPDLVQVICYVGGGLCAAVSEGWWTLARKYGWSV
jgi:hypothetical protein